MGRPSRPLISRSAVLELALRIIDAEGLEALSLRRLADEIGVNAASLYYHFATKDEIVVGAAELALMRTPIHIPEHAHRTWQEVVFAGAVQLRDFLLAHPTLVSVIVRRRLEGMGDRLLERTTALLVDAGVSMDLIAPIYDGLERYILGTAMRQIAEGEAAQAPPSPANFPLLAEALRKQSMDSERLFEISCFAIMNAIEASSPKGAQPRETSRRTRSTPG